MSRVDALSMLITCRCVQFCRPSDIASVSSGGSSPHASAAG